MALTIFVRLVRIAAGFGVSVLTARLLGPAGRGDYFFVVALCAIVVQLSHFGFASSNTYLVAKQPQAFGALVTNSVWVSIIGGGGIGIVFVGVLVAGGWFNIAPELLAFAVPLAPVTLFYLLGTNLLVGSGRIVLFNAIETSANLLLLVVILAAAIILPTAGGMLTASVLGWALASAGLLWILARHSSVGTAFDRTVFRAGVTYAARAYVITLLSLLVLRSCVFFIQRLAGSEALGQFSVASQVAEVIGIVPASAGLVLFPRLAGDLRGSWPLTVRTCGRLGLLLAAVTGLAAFIASPVVQLIYGPAFAASAVQLMFLLPGVVFLGMLIVVSQYIAAIGIPTSIICAWGAGLLLVIVLCAWLVPLAGAIGAALALSTTYLLLFMMAAAIAFAHRGASQLSPRPNQPG